MSNNLLEQNWRVILNPLRTATTTRQQPQPLPPDYTIPDPADIQVMDVSKAGTVSAFWWITANGQLHDATADVYSFNLIGWESKSLFGGTEADDVTEEYAVLNGETLTITDTDVLGPHDIMIAYDTDLLAQDAPLHRAINTVFKECGEDIRWIAGDSECVIRRVEVKCGPVSGARDRFPAHIGFAFGPRESITKLFEATHSAMALFKARPDLRSIQNTEHLVAKNGWALGHMPEMFADQIRMGTKPDPFHPAIIVAIPTENANKVALVKEYFHRRLPIKSAVYFEIVPSISGVGEQPYDEAGPRGAWNRMRNAMCHVAFSPELKELWKSRKATEVYIATIENFIQTKGVARPADFGVVIVSNLKRKTYSGCLTAGVTIAPEYVAAAKYYGVDGAGGTHGRVTVGTVLAARFPGLDKANWHEVVAGVSRYELLRKAINSLPLP
ncbi:hypothetical protein Micbo1qcDRAFT_197309 [Microdochium bolleyi]|uniref:Uncharacterized protein n=1 Tax=Microdochium bolleyi TaxID=196109 RepID=A0A136IUD1_9PEZI|nr:hypothetical protein Micbo1qcDRAFT_197309 [Microdochium bolleyi]